ncbi:late competence protein ComER [Peribacillus cavernae]|uniref:Late competence protein ComER n=1 Tax=Peribacillus cavernae TaxID=1674310 RepID=A0A433HWC4_9BACI|nr:late competence protein ComER [Peribacillus cavernae]MDQ0218234.1 competence protein ComER [Peribacillus cavernae]RUQ32632.1 late competence protein ComER [Peribacillus cavernae]
MKIGVIGTGNMGTILIEALLEANALEATDLTITNRTLSKSFSLKEKYAGISVADSCEKVARESEAIFICVKPLEFHHVITDIKPHINSSQCVISITSPISVAQLESKLDCNCARFIPSITSRALSGVSLLSFGDGCSPAWVEALTDLAACISTPVKIENDITRVASDIVSCGPAFFSYLARAFIDGACKQTKIDEQTATLLTEKMLVGLGELLKKEIYTLPALQEKVCVKGGVTGEGIKVLDAKVGDMFQQLFHATHEKFEEDIEKVEEQYGTPY